MKFVLDVKLKGKAKDGSTFSLLRFSPILIGESLLTRNFLLEECESILKKMIRGDDILVKIDNNFFIITNNATRKISDSIIRRYQDNFRQKLNLGIKTGISFFDPAFSEISVEQMIAQALAD